MFDKSNIYFVYLCLATNIICVGNDILSHFKKNTIAIRLIYFNNMKLALQ